MWKAFFEFCYFWSYFIPGKKLRTRYRRDVLFDYKAKLNALRAHFSELNWSGFRLAKGGGSLAFIVENRYVFKIRKFHLRDNSIDKFSREKRITDAIARVLPVRVPHIELVQLGDYLVYKSEFIPGRVLVDIPLETIREHREKIGNQLGQIIYTLFNARLTALRDMRPKNAGADCGMVHGDMCSNIIVNPETMDVVGIIDWEYAGFNSLRAEFFGLFRVRRKMRLTDIAPQAMWEYYRLRDEDTKKQK